MLFAGTRPVVGESLVELARVADTGGFCVGAGTLLFRDLRGPFRLAPRNDGDTVGDE
jgi:hypothetical protein